MNINYWLQRFIGKPTCHLGSRTKLLASAKIINIRACPDCINIGTDSVIAGELLTFAHGGSITIGDWCFIGQGTRIWSSISITIGERSLIAHNVNIFDSLTHPINRKKRHDHFKAIVQTGHPRDVDLGEKAVVIENDVWIGANSCILRGVHIGEGAIVGAGAVVTHDVPSFTIVAGNPAHIVRELLQHER